MFFAQISFELVFLTVDLLIKAVSGELSYTHPKHIPVFSILRLSVPQFWTTPSDQLPSHGTVAAHAPCHVNYKLEGGGKMTHVFEIPHKNLHIHFVNFQGATTKIKLCYKR